MREPIKATGNPEGVGLEHWSQWKHRCALGLCADDTQHVLRKFAGIHFSRYLSRYANRTNAPNMRHMLSDTDAWHLFETYLAVNSSRGGKRYKDWLFARAANEANKDAAVTAGAVLMMRDVVRAHLRREYSADLMVSLSQPLEGVGSPFTVEDLLPGMLDPLDEIAERECAALARTQAQGFLQTMDHRERIAVLAKKRGMSLAHPAVCAAADCGKSVLHESFHAAARRLVTMLKETFKSEEPESVKMLVLMTFEEVSGLVLAWAASGDACATVHELAEVS